MKMTTNMSEDEILGRIKMGVNVDIKRSDGKKKTIFSIKVYSIFSVKSMPPQKFVKLNQEECYCSGDRNQFRVNSFKAIGVVLQTVLLSHAYFYVNLIFFKRVHSKC